MAQQSYDRRDFLRLCLAGTAGAAMAGGHVSTALAEGAGGQGARPNIVYIMADDLGWGDVGYNGSAIQTPNIDRLAEGGIRLEQQYVMPTCTPTRVGLMTGRYPSRYGVLGPDYGEVIDKGDPTLASVLSQCGYHTALSGKWHMGSPPEYVPMEYGFDSSYGYFHGQIDPYTHLYKTGVKSWHRDDEYIEEEGHATDLITDEAVRVIEEKRDEPFFLFVAYSVPHYPLDEPEKWTAMYEDVFSEPSRRWYAASVTHMDAGIGQIIEALENTGQRDNTLVVFISDNGGQKSWSNDNQYHGRYADKPHTVLGNNEPLRGWKGDLYEGGIRVPAVVNWPGRLEPGSVDAPMHIVDWVPALFALGGCKPAPDMKLDGQNIWPVIAGKETPPEKRVMYWKTPGGHAIREGRWKLIVPRNDGEAELYDLEADPHETRDRIGDKPEVGERLRTLLERHKAEDR